MQYGLQCPLQIQSRSRYPKRRVDSTETCSRTLVVSLDSRPFFIRARALAMVLRREPSALQGSIVQYIPPEVSYSQRYPRMQQALVVSFLPAATVSSSQPFGRQLGIFSCGRSKTLDPLQRVWMVQNAVRWLIYVADLLFTKVEQQE